MSADRPKRAKPRKAPDGKADVTKPEPPRVWILDERWRPPEAPEPKPTSLQELGDRIRLLRELDAALPPYPSRRHVSDDEYWRFHRMYLDLDGGPYPETGDASRDLETLEKGCRVKEPVSKRAGLILDKLKSLPEHEAMNTAALLAWLSKFHHDDIDDATLRRTLREMKPYGLLNKPKIGYYLR